MNNKQMAKKIRELIAFSSFEKKVVPSTKRDRPGVRIYSEVLTATTIGILVENGYMVRNIKPIDETTIVAFVEPRGIVH